ncbi:MAG: hypothetical protein JW955_18740 [Sedimentisphaerales bacterium]|nr:hypothetical protein [Sedimentisphaerales bacterium]
MGRLTVPLIAITLVAASCAVHQNQRAAGPFEDQDKSVETSGLSLTPPKPLDDDWSRWLVGQWDCLAESDTPGFKVSVKGRGQMNVEMGLGGQFLLIRMEGKMAQISDEYLRHLRQDLHAPEEEIQALQNLAFSNLELRSIDPRNGQIIAYLFDSWRCVAQGVGSREADREIMEWQWSLAGAGTSVRVTERVGDNKIVMVEKYSLVDGSTMEDRAVMVRRQSAPAASGDLAFLTPR